MKEEGQVKWFAANKGFGFIQRKGQQDIFVHFSAIVGEGYKTLNEGDHVKFNVQDSPKGLQAVDVEKV